MTDRYGAEIVNYNNKLIIDSNYSCVTKLQSGSINLVSGVNTVALTTPSDKPVVVFLKPSTSGFCTWCGVDMYNNYIINIKILSSTTQTISYMVGYAGCINTPAPDSYGMTIYDGNGNICFSASDAYEDKYIKKTGIYSPPMELTFKGGVQSVYVTNSNTEYYLLIPKVMGKSITSYNNKLRIYLGTLRSTTTSTRIEVSHTLFFERVLPNTTTTNSEGVIVINNIINKSYIIGVV